MSKFPPSGQNFQHFWLNPFPLALVGTLRYYRGTLSIGINDEGCQRINSTAFFLQKEIHTLKKFLGNDNLIEALT